MIQKICTKCNENKDLIDYYHWPHANGQIYFKNMCKKCTYKFKKNKTAEQKIKFAVYKKEWKIINKIRENKKYREKLKNNPVFKLRKNISRSINSALKENSKNGSILKYLPYSINDLKSHLENQFDNKMSWDNYGIYWHLDHIIPQSCLTYITMNDDSFKKCWALDNLRPLDAKQNMMDGSTKIRHKMYKNKVEAKNLFIGEGNE